MLEVEGIQQSILSVGEERLGIEACGCNYHWTHEQNYSINKTILTITYTQSNHTTNTHFLS
jgi:hypothetical protein